MHRPPDVDNLRDFQQYYVGSWIGYRDSGEKFLPLYINKVESDANISCLAVTDNEGGEQTKTLSWKELREYGQFGHPRLGAFNVENTSGYMTRNSNRTANRGYRTQGIHMHVFGMWILSTEGMRVPQAASRDVLFSIFNPQYFPVRGLVEMLMQGERISGAVSRKVTLCMEEGYSWPTVYYAKDLVGFLQDGYLLNTVDNASAEYAKTIKDKFPEIRVA